MIRHVIVCMALFAVSGAQSYAGGAAFEDIAYEILSRERGAPTNSRHDAYQMLRRPNDPVVDAVWRVKNVRFRPAAEGALWPQSARERYEVHGCAVHRVARAKPPVIGIPAGAAVDSTRARIQPAASRASPEARQIAFLFHPTAAFAVKALASADGTLVFNSKPQHQERSCLQLIRFNALGVETLPGREPEGTLDRLVPDPEARRVQIEGTVSLPSNDAGRGGACPRLQFTAQFSGGTSSLSQICEIKVPSSAC